MDRAKAEPDDIFCDALDLASSAERDAYLDRACGGDADLRRRVQRLLAAHAQADSFLAADPSVAAATTDLVAEAPGAVIGPYKLLEQIGEGGFGMVFMAEQQEPIRRKVALKVLKPGMDSKQVIARFEAERQALALMDHPNIAKVLDAGQTSSGRPYFVMELVKALPITDYCDQSRHTPRERLELFANVCRAMQHAHQKGVIHRDLKPSNVLVTVQDGRPLVKVIDFGIAKALGQQLTDKTLFTGFAQMIGTPLYMSPDQAALSNVDVDTRSDIYSLGVLLYELLTGRTPFDKERFKEVGYDEIRRIIREEEPPRPSTRISTLGQAGTVVSTQRKSDPKRLSQLFRGELDWIVMKALEKDRNRRYETASAFAADVQRYLADEPVLACPPSAAYRLGKFARRNKTGLAVAGLVLSFVVSLGGVAGWFVRDRAARQAEVAQQTRESLSRVRTLIADKKVPMAWQELAEAKGRLGDDRTRLPALVQEVEAVEEKLQALEANLARFQRFVDLIEQSYEAELGQPVTVLPADFTPGMVTLSERAVSPWKPDKSIPLKLEALSCYGILEKDDWSVCLEADLLEPDQVARVRRTAYDALLRLASDVLNRTVDHRSGRELSPQEAGKQGLAYLRQAEAAARPIFETPTSAFYRIRAQCREALGQDGAARQDEADARRTRKAFAIDHTALAYDAAFSMNKAKALQHFEAALRVEPSHYWSLYNLALVHLNLGQQEQDFALAASGFTGCIMKRPGHALPYVSRGKAYLKLHRYQEALADCSRAIEIDPKLVCAWHQRGAVYARQGQYEKAIADYSKAIELDPMDAVCWYGRGIIFSGLGQLDKAEADYREALRLRRDFPEAHNNLGNVLHRKGQVAEAIAEYRDALRLRPNDPLAHYNLGNSLQEQGKVEEAEAELREALRLRPNYIEAHCNLSSVLLAQGKHREAEAACREALRLSPRDAVAFANLAKALNAQGKHREAETACREALRLRPGDPKFHKNLGIILHNQRKFVEADAEFREALRLRPDDPEGHCALGINLRKQGRFAEALTALRRGHELGSRQPNWRRPSAELIRQTEQLAVLDAKLPQVLHGEVTPADAAERIGLAKLCHEYKSLYASAARFYAEAFAAEPKLADDLRTQDRYNAACAAALAGCGQGAGAGKLDEKERARLRRQALDWLRADLAAWGCLLEKVPDQARAAAQQTLRHWQQDADFAGVRGDTLAMLPEAERQSWQQLWADVERTLIKANPKDTKATPK